MNGNSDASPVHFVLGATGLVGSHVARMLAASGARLALAGRETARLEALAQETGAAAFSFNAVRFDHVEAALQETRRAMGRLDGVVHCVGTRPRPSDLADAGLETWNNLVDADLTSAAAAVRAAQIVMRHHGGSVVLTSGFAGKVGVPGLELWSAAKAGVEGLTRAAAAGYARYGLRYNCVAPGPLAPPSLPDDPELAEAFSSGLPPAPLGGQGSARDVAQTIVWLLDEKQNWVTGQVFRIDGGLSCCRA